jgi:hypothetical protein
MIVPFVVMPGGDSGAIHGRTSLARRQRNVLPDW